MMKKTTEAQSTSVTLREGYSLPMAFVAFAAVVFFGIAIEMVARWLMQPVFAIGGLLCTLAGFCMVLWQTLLVVTGKNLRRIRMAFYIQVIAGWILLRLGIYLKSEELSMNGIFSLFLGSPFRWFFYISLLLILFSCIVGILGPSHSKMRNCTCLGMTFLAQAGILLGVICMFYVADYYHAGETANAIVFSSESGDASLLAEEPRDEVEVIFEEKEHRLVFLPADPAAEEMQHPGLIFYQGAKVEFTAYAPLLQSLAEQGILCVLTQMPDNLAVLNVDAAKGIPAKFPQVKSWYLAGHSLGGAMAAHYLTQSADPYQGLILLGSYSDDDLSDTTIRVLLIHGADDKILTMEKYGECLKNYPQRMTERVIDGGNHSYFGDYGQQDGDGKAQITPEEQWRITTEYIKEFLLSQ